MQMAQQQDQQLQGEDLWEEALNQLVDRHVLAEHAREDTLIEIGEAEVEQQVERQINQMVEQAGSEEQLEQMYGLSLIELREEFREDVREQMLAQRMRMQEMQDVDITPTEVREWFEQIPEHELPTLPETVRLAHIVRYPETPEEARAEARDQLEDLRQSIVHGDAEFEEVAREHSDDTGTARNGGQIRNVNVNDLQPEFAAILSQSEPGEVSQVFFNEQQNGFHIVRLNERTGDQVDFNHILIRIDETQADAQGAIDHLSEVRDTLMNSEVPFALMARRHSEEEESSINAGRVVDPRSGTRDLVYQALDRTWRSTLDTMEVGEISEPTEVQLLNGDRAYHIVKKQRHIEEHRVNLETDYDQIRQFALEDKRSREMREWLDRLREDMYVDIRMSPAELAAAQ